MLVALYGSRQGWFVWRTYVLCINGLSKYDMPINLAVCKVNKCKKISAAKILQRFCSLKRVLLVIFILFCDLSCRSIFAQNEMQFSGSANMPLALNPASAGRSGEVDVLGAYRTQWVGFKGAPSTTVLGVDGEVKFLKSFHGVGACVFHDVIGKFTTMNINANYSYHVELNKGLLGIGMRLGAINMAYNPSQLQPAVAGAEDDYHQQTDEALQGDDESATTLDVGLGAYYQTKRAYLSLSLLHVNAPVLSMKSGAELQTKPVLVLSAGRRITSEQSKCSFEAQLLAKSDFSSLQVEALGVVGLGRFAWGALGYRLQDAMLLQAGVNLNNGISVGYGYDLGLSRLRTYHSGSHEVVVGYTFNVDIEKRTKRYKSVRIL